MSSSVSAEARRFKLAHLRTNMMVSSPTGATISLGRSLAGHVRGGDHALFPASACEGRHIRNVPIQLLDI